MQQSELGARVERRRKEIGMGQTELAFKAGVSQ
ncbi:TPA: XRE family transcriptional regulator, partial [Shigella sonnei]|nr:XRE family transcriptional regulator [Shigella sonnei]